MLHDVNGMHAQQGAKHYNRCVATQPSSHPIKFTLSVIHLSLITLATTFHIHHLPILLQ